MGYILSLLLKQTALDYKLIALPAFDDPTCKTVNLHEDAKVLHVWI